MTELLKNALDLFYANKYEEAVEQFLKMEEEDDQNARLLNNIGLCYANLGDYEKAHWYYGKALALDTKQAQTYVNEADLLFKEHRILDAIELLQNAVYELPEDVTTRHYLARVYMEDKRYEEAIQALDAVLELSPKNPDAHWDLGMVYFELGDWHSAIGNFEQVLEVVENNPLIYYQTGLAYEANDEQDKAISNYMKAIAANQTFPLAYKKLGMHFAARGDRDGAIEYYEDYLKFDLPEQEKEEINRRVREIKVKADEVN